MNNIPIFVKIGILNHNLKTVKLKFLFDARKIAFLGVLESITPVIT